MNEAALEAMENELRKAQMAIGQVSGYDAAFASLQSCVSLLHTLRAALSAAPVGDAEIKAIRGRHERFNECSVITCPRCDGEGGYPESTELEACYDSCLRCDSLGYIVDPSFIHHANTLFSRVDVLAAELAAERARVKELEGAISRAMQTHRPYADESGIVEIPLSSFAGLVRVSREQKSRAALVNKS